MPILGTPTFAGDVNTLAELSLRKQIAQDQATQNAISSSTRSVGNLMQNKRQTDVLRFQQGQDDERYAFRETMDAAQQGLLTPDQLESAIPSFNNKQHQDVLRSVAGTIRESEQRIEEEAPLARNRLQSLIQPLTETITQRQKEIDRIQGGGGFYWTDKGRQQDIQRLQQEQAFDMEQANKTVMEFENVNQHLANRFIVDPLGRVVDSKMSGSGGGGRPSPSSGTTQPPANATVAPPPVTPGVPDFGRDVLGAVSPGPVVPAQQPQPVQPPISAPAAGAPAAPAATNVLPPPQSAAPQQQYERLNVSSIGRPVQQPPVDIGAAPPRSSAPDLNIDPTTGQVAFTNQQGTSVDAQTLLGPELIQAMIQRVNYLMANGMSQSEAEAAAGIWAMRQQQGR
ncbi:MAG: hypothetical protein ACWGQW_03545 [bacterium]